MRIIKSRVEFITSINGDVILKPRCSKAAHPQMRGGGLATQLLKEPQEKIPVLFDGIDPEG